MARYTFVTESHTFGDDKKAVEILSRSEVTTIAEEAAKEGYIKPEDVERLIAFRNNPSDESWIGGGK